MKRTKLTPTQIAQKQIKNAVNAKNDYVQGVKNVNESPMAKAADHITKMKDNFVRAIDNGRTERSLRAVKLVDWQNKTTTIGANNYVTGVQNSLQATVDFQTAASPVREAISQEVQAMPSATLQDNIARMVANATQMSQYMYDKANKTMVPRTNY